MPHPWRPVLPGHMKSDHKVKSWGKRWTVSPPRLRPTSRAPQQLQRRLQSSSLRLAGSDLHVAVRNVWTARNRSGLRQSAHVHGNLVAGILTRTELTVLERLVGECFFLHHSKTHAAEKVGDAGEQTYASHALMPCLLQQGIDQHSSCTPALRLRGDGDGTDLGEVHPIQMQRATTDDLALILHHNEIADVLADVP